MTDQLSRDGVKSFGSHAFLTVLRRGRFGTLTGVGVQKFDTQH
jgi:hypothetical protein